MGKYLLRRLANYAVLLFVAVSFAYFLAATQLHPRQLFEMRNPPMDPNSIDNILYAANVNDKTPVLQRYVTWLGSVFGHWNWGTSPKGGSVNEEVSRRMWVSLRLMLPGWLLGVVLGVAIGAYTATKQYKVSDRVATAFTLFLIATPSFVLGTVVQILAIKFNKAVGSTVFYVSQEQTAGTTGFWNLLLDRAHHIILPTLVLTLLGLSSLSRLQRNLMLDSLGADYVRTARAKGLRRSKAVVKHALRTALIPTGTYIAFQVSGLFLGATYTERIFGYNGMGIYGVSTISGLDINGVVAVTAFGGVCYLVGATLADIFVAILDPRVRLS